MEQFSPPRSNLIARLKHHWFLVALVLVVIVATSFPHVFDAYAEEFDTRWAVIFIMFLNALTLETSRLLSAIRRPLVAATGVFFSFFFAAAFGYPIARLLLPLSADLAVGLIIISAMPTTLASGTIWTRMANGNDALSMVITVVGNSISFVVSPAILSLALATTVVMEPLEMMQKLFVVVVLPVGVAQVCLRCRAIRERAVQWKAWLSMIAQMMILNIIFVGIVGGVATMKKSSGGMSVTALMAGVLAVVAVHLLAMAGCWAAGRAMHLPRADRLAIMFNGAQKTLPAALYICAEFFPRYPFAPIACVLYHVCQLVVDSWLVEIARLREKRLRFIGEDEVHGR